MQHDHMPGRKFQQQATPVNRQESVCIEQGTVFYPTTAAMWLCYVFPELG